MSEKLLYEYFLLSGNVLSTGAWQPAVDLYETPRGWLLKYDLAGVRLEDVRVRSRGCRITVEGVRRDVTTREVATRYSMEIAYNRFERTVELPCDLPDPEIELAVEDGFLYVHVRDQSRERSDDEQQSE